ncbi:MAG: TonB-dependent receptor [Gammaproteobacteria bacterium]
MQYFSVTVPKSLNLIITAVLALLFAFSVSADVLEEIIVTAQKREQNLQEVGLSVTAFTGQQLKELGFTDSVDVVSMTPGLNYTTPNAEGSQINFFLRGVGLNDFTDANENPVATYVDEVYHGAMGGLAFQLFDMERTEVLRGPQGTLYGRNTTGGLVHFITKRPTEEFEAYGDFTAGFFGQAKFEGAIGGPIKEVDNLLARVSLAVNKNSGYTKNDGPTRDFNNTDAFAGRVQLLYNPTDDLEVLIKAHISQNRAQVGAWQHQSTRLTGPNGDISVPLAPTAQDTSVDCNADLVLNAADLRPAPGTDCFGYVDTDGDPHRGNYNRNGKVKVDNWGLSGRIEWNVAGLDIISITAFEKVDRIQEEDTDAGPFPLIEPTFGADTDQITQEIRVSGQFDKLHWMGGFFYFDNTVDAHYLLDTTNLAFVFLDSNYRQDTNSWSIFGQLDYDISDQFSISGGARFTRETKEMDYEGFETSGLFAFLTGLGVIPITPTRPTPNHTFLFNKSTVGDLAESDRSNGTARVEFDWRPMDDVMLYTSFSRGVKSAGFNTGFLDESLIFASNTAATVPFKDEVLHAYEAGIKSTLFNGTTRINLTGFYYDYRDFQTFRFELLNQIIFNTDATIFGGELELATSPWEGWDFQFGLSLMDATADDIPSPSGAEIRDRNLVSAPDVSANALARYEWHQFGGTMAIQATANYQSQTYFDIQNQPVSKQDGYVVGNARLQYTSGNENWYAAVFVNNIADEEYITYTFDFTSLFGFNQQNYGKPRWIGGTVGYSWK